jgi:pyruvate/2-oxoglutarate dehydrogenase complex dihydrolipoamide dehydrogenase (E3) component
MSSNVKYYNAYATFVDAKTVKAVDKKGKETTITADAFVIATGGRPKVADIPGKELCITSDDIFAMKTTPGKTLVVGASYVALECAGFLHGVGFDTSVMMRSIPLRGFDQQMAGQIKTYMQEEGCTFIEKMVPVSVEMAPSGRKLVKWTSTDGASSGEGEFDTVLFAVGRDVCTNAMGLDATGVALNPKNGKVPTVDEQTNVPHIYAIGDVIDGDALSPPSALTELTPVAIQAGKVHMPAHLNHGTSDHALLSRR